MPYPASMEESKRKVEATRAKRLEGGNFPRISAFGRARRAGANARGTSRQAMRALSKHYVTVAVCGRLGSWCLYLPPSATASLRKFANKPPAGADLSRDFPRR